MFQLFKTKLKSAEDKRENVIRKKVVSYESTKILGTFVPQLIDIKKHILDLELYGLQILNFFY
jgi:hypothetical protein